MAEQARNDEQEAATDATAEIRWAEVLTGDVRDSRKQGRDLREDALNWVVHNWDGILEALSPLIFQLSLVFVLSFFPYLPDLLRSALCVFDHSKTMLMDR